MDNCYNQHRYNVISKEKILGILIGAIYYEEKDCSFLNWMV